MNVIILPLLIVNSLNLNNETWPYGPELRYNVTYNVKTNLQRYLLNQTNQMVVYNHATQLTCRPRTLKILNCLLSKPTVFLTFYNGTNKKPVVSNAEDGEKELANFNFEIRFNRFGIKELVVPSTVSPFILDMVRAIVNQFHTGLDLTDKTQGTYRAWENFTTGDCFTSYAVRLSDDLTESSAVNTNNELKTWRPQMTTFINKTRNIEKCRITAPYFFGSRESWRDNPRVIINLKSSKSTITANESTFASCTETLIELHYANSQPPGKMTMSEKMTVTLVSVVPAKKEIEKIEDPASAGIVTGKWLHDDFSEENATYEKQTSV